MPVRSRVTGLTALHLAAGAAEVLCDPAVPHDRRRAALVRLLLERGADATVPDAIGQVAAFGAVICDDPQSLLLLLDAEPPTDPSSADKSGTTLLMRALSCANGPSIPCALLLLRRGADVHPVRPVMFSSGRYEWHMPGMYESALGLVLGANYYYSSPEYHHRAGWDFQKLVAAIAGLVSAGAAVPRNRERHMLNLMPAILRHLEGTAAFEGGAERRRQKILEQEDMVGLALDFGDLREAEQMVARRQARLRELGDSSGSDGDSEDEGDSDGGGDNDVAEN